MRKELPFNKYTLYFGNSSMFVETTNIKVKEKDRYIWYTITKIFG